MPVLKPKKKNSNKAYYHIYNKAIDERNLFADKQDYQTFLGFLSDYLSSPADGENAKKVFTVKGKVYRGVPHQPKNYLNKIELLAYNLRSDHFHLLVRQITKGSVEKLIRSLGTRYAMYYNKKYQRTGSLFQGPYKSVDIKNISSLLYLTHYFHYYPKVRSDNLTENYSSYLEYLGERETPWIKPKAVLSYFERSENASFKGVKGYKNFVEKYKLNQKEKKLLQGVILESESEHLVRSLPPLARSQTPQKAYPKEIFSEEKASEKVQSDEVNTNTVLEPPLRVSEFLATATAVFIILVALGVRNIKVTSAAQYQHSLGSAPSPTPQVSGIEDTKPEKTVIIKIDDGSQSVNLRQEPTTKSGKVGKANDGEVFEFISIESDGKSEWYQIMYNESPAFVSARYAEIIEKGNN